MKKIAKSWGNIFSSKFEEIEYPMNDRVVLSFGNQNSYGDSSIPLNNLTIKDSYNNDNSYLSPSMTVHDFLLSKDKFLYGTPGRSNVTIAGAVASDTHGKDNLWGGGFHKNVDTILLRINDEILEASRTKNIDLFETTIGGYGLTGQITGIKLSGNAEFFDSYTTKYKYGEHINNLLNSFSFVNNNFWVGWVDLLDKNKKWISESSTPDTVSSNNEIKFRNNLSSNIPISLSFIGKNKLRSLSLINNFYFYFHKNRNDKSKKLNNILYPISKFTDTRLISSKNKIIQVQFSLPIEKTNQIDQLLEKLIYKQNPLLCSVKRIANPEFQNNLSFLQDGWTFAVDFVYEDFNHLSIRDFYSDLIKNNGKIYLAKDSTLKKEEFHEMYPEYQEWIKIVNKYDKNKSFQSLMSKRLNLK